MTDRKITTRVELFWWVFNPKWFFMPVSSLVTKEISWRKLPYEFKISFSVIRKYKLVMDVKV